MTVQSVSTGMWDYLKPIVRDIQDPLCQPSLTACCSFPLGRCELRIESCPFKTLYQNNEIRDLTIT